MASIFFGGLIHDGACVVLQFKDNQTCFPFWRFLKLRNSAWNFWGLIFSPGIFLGFVASHMGLFLVSIFGPIQSSLSSVPFFEGGRRKALVCCLADFL